MSQDSCSFQTRIQGFQRQSDLLPDSSGFGSEVGVLRNLCLALELVDVAAGTRGTCTRRAQA